MKQSLAIVIDNRTRGQMVSICSVHQVQPGRLTIRHGGMVGPLAENISQINSQSLPVMIVGDCQSEDSSGFTRFFAPAQLMCRVVGWQIPGKKQAIDLVATAFQPEWGAVPLTLHSIRDAQCAAAARLAVELRSGTIRILNGQNDLVEAIEWRNFRPERPVFEAGKLWIRRPSCSR